MRARGDGRETPMAPFRTCVDSKQHLKKNFHLGRKWSLGARFHLKFGNSLAGDSLHHLARACASEGDRRPHDTNPTRWRSHERRRATPAIASATLAIVSTTAGDRKYDAGKTSLTTTRCTRIVRRLRARRFALRSAAGVRCKKVSRTGPAQFAMTFPRMCAGNCVR
jgi:hypothetical protein